MTIPNTPAVTERVVDLRTFGPWRGRGGWLEGPDALKPWREPWPDDTDIGRLDAEMVERADRVPTGWPRRMGDERRYVRNAGLR